MKTRTCEICHHEFIDQNDDSAYPANINPNICGECEVEQNAPPAGE